MSYQVNITDIDFTSLETVEEYYEFFNQLKQRLLFFAHLNYSDDELLELIKDLGLKENIIEVIKNYISKIKETNRRLYVKENDKNVLLQMWYSQYLDFGKRNGNSHFPDLIIFDFQVNEINELLKEFEPYIKGEAKKVLEALLEKIYNNEYNSFKPFLTEYYRDFQVKLEVIEHPLELKIIGVPTQRTIVNYKFPEGKFSDFIGSKNNRPIVSFISKLRLIILGGQKLLQGDRYEPFFMSRTNIKEEIKAYMNSRLNAVIKKYYPRLLTEKKIPPSIKKADLVQNSLNLPTINFTVFKYIDWDFMPENQFYDGVCVKKGKGKVIYTIQTHPLNLFLVYYFKDDFELFLDQLLHHEFIHLLQYRATYIYDNIIRNDKVKLENPVEYKLISTLGLTHWINELKSPDNPRGYDPSSNFKTMEGYVMSMGGHTPRFVKEVNKFENCKKTMIIRGKIQTLYAGFYFKLYGHDMFKGFWHLCSPKD